MALPGTGGRDLNAGVKQLPAMLGSSSSHVSLDSQGSSGQGRAKGTGSPKLKSLASSEYLAPDESNGLTFTDLLFCSERAAEESLGKNIFLPLPPSLIALTEGKQVKRKESVIKRSRVRDEAAEKHMAEASLGLQLQEYFKTFAFFPTPIPGIEESRTRMLHFIEAFQMQQGVLNYCGERFKTFNAFVVICPEKICLRSHPSTLSEDMIPGKVIHPGQMVIAERILSFNKGKFLKTREEGWAFERKGSIRCMAHVSSVEIGLWWYCVVSQEYAEIRKTPSFSDRVRSGHILCPGEVCVVALRCVVDDRHWMQLADGRGWIFQMRPPDAPRLHEEKMMPDVVMAECKDGEADPFKEDSTNTTSKGAVPKSSALEAGLWEYQCVEETLAIGGSESGNVIFKESKVLVDYRVPANDQKSKDTGKPTVKNRIWLKLSDGRGWVPKTGVDGAPLFKFVRMANSSVEGQPLRRTGTIESWASAESLLPEEGWMHGIA